VLSKDTRRATYGVRASESRSSGCTTHRRVPGSPAVNAVRSLRRERRTRAPGADARVRDRDPARRVV